MTALPFGDAVDERGFDADLPVWKVGDVPANTVRRRFHNDQGLAIRVPQVPCHECSVGIYLFGISGTVGVVDVTVAVEVAVFVILDQAQATSGGEAAGFTVELPVEKRGSALEVG